MVGSGSGPAKGGWGSGLALAGRTPLTANSIPVRAALRPVGALLREWRHRQQLSQLDLALEVGVSSRHLSFVETGRSKPSPELVDALATRLDVPLRERNTLLLSAGYAPRYPTTPLDADAMGRARQVIQRLLDAHDPYPGVAIDRAWNVVLANRGATALVAHLPTELTGPPLNVFRACLHPDGLALATTNLEAWARYLYGQLRRLGAGTDPAVDALIEEITAYPAVTALRNWHRSPSVPAEAPVVPWELDLGGRHLSLMTTVTIFGTPQDVLLDDLAIELFYPLDDATEATLGGPAGL